MGGKVLISHGFLAAIVGAILLPSEAMWFVARVRTGDIGMDSAHAYWNVWGHDLYSLAPGQPDAFNYSPAVAQVLWPATLLPWPVFFVAFCAVLVASLVWMLWPLPPAWRWVLIALTVPIAVSVANIELLFGALIVLGLRRPGLWAVPLLTKVTAGLGVGWFVARGEWRRALRAVLVAALVVTVSVSLTPELWLRWLHFLMESPTPSTQDGYPPLWARLPVAAGLLWWGARRDRKWTLAVAVALSIPLWSLGTVLILAAIPRLQNDDDETAPTLAWRVGADRSEPLEARSV